jgi:hypothetical protein
MPSLTITAEGSPLFRNFLAVVSVTLPNGAPCTGLRVSHFTFHRLASRNHASCVALVIREIQECPTGAYTVQFEPDPVQPDRPPGHYVLHVAVRRVKRGEPEAYQGQRTFTCEIL